MKYKICIVTQAHLCRNPRVLKEAICLHDAGYGITILNSAFDAALKLEDLNLLKGRNINLHSVSDLSKSGFTSIIDRMLQKVGVTILTKLKFETQLALGYAPWRYLKILRKHEYDLYICHQELPSCLGTLLMKEGFKVAFDFEDWYSEDLLPEARKGRALKTIQNAEKIALQHAGNCWTTSNAMAKSLAIRYNSKEPHVIYNTFSSQIIAAKTIFKTPLKLFWFSQTLGKGRGLEPFINILIKLNCPFELHLLGRCNSSYKNDLKSLVNNKFKLEFHELQPNHLLPSYISQFDIGLALEQNEPLSRKYTITNKLFQYLQAGLPLIATDTPGQKEIIGKTKAGVLIDLSKPEQWIHLVESFLTDHAVFHDYRQNAIQAAKKYKWEIERGKLLNIISKILQ